LAFTVNTVNDAIQLSNAQSHRSLRNNFHNVRLSRLALEKGFEQCNCAFIFH